MIEPIAYVRLLEGKSNAHLIKFNDGKDYVVKYFQPGFEKSLPNEWIAYSLARYLGLPIPFARLVEIPEEFSSEVPQLAQLNFSKTQFASLFVPRCSNGHQVCKVDEISNHHSLAAIILFDYWLYNRDRTLKNILLHEENPNSFHLRVIDHAEIFGSYCWALPDLSKLPAKIMKSRTHQLMALFIEDKEAFGEGLEIIQRIPTFLIEEIVSLIPEDWNVPQEEKKAIVNALVHRRKKYLPRLIDKFIHKVYLPLHEKNE
ncbi:hypothetical protein PH210_17565 [Paenibacillus sp. BSR1-1]|uniref:HipA family kinase n=1 Tax=Paenibacillus sp. BSR1-1 TaxID=3020845 RepID=UPI0025B2350F|nr:HipA family kinase [Paenibacillus sp. BSR1-1]MDN3018007.1 hypothetical protein [Paenibacillus sp. BSR1-1]